MSPTALHIFDFSPRHKGNNMVFGSKQCILPGCHAKTAKKSNKCHGHGDHDLCDWPLCPFGRVESATTCVFHKCSTPECLHARWHDRNSTYCHACHLQRMCHASTAACTVWSLPDTRHCSAHTCQNDACDRECHANEEYCRQCAAAASKQYNVSFDVPAAPPPSPVTPPLSFPQL